MELWEKRLEICKACPLYQENSETDIRCNKRKFINKEGEWSWLPKEGFKQGCNCLILKKIHDPQAHCIVEKW